MNADEQGSHDARQYIKFLAAGQEFAADIMDIREIRGWTDTTALPHSADYVRGVINLRGTVLPVIDLKSRLGMGKTEPTSSHVIMVVSSGSRLFGVLVDAVLDILTVSSGDIQPVPDTGHETANEYMDGIAVLDGKMVTLLGMEKLTGAANELAAA